VIYKRYNAQTKRAQVQGVFMRKIGSRLVRAVNALDHSQIVALIALAVVALIALCTPLVPTP